MEKEEEESRMQSLTVIQITGSNQRILFKIIRPQFYKGKI